MAAPQSQSQPATAKKREPIHDEDVGLTILQEAPDPSKAIDIVAIHGLAAHPKYTWNKKVNNDDGTSKTVNWLKDPDMLPAIAPNARILRFGYHSDWFGEEATDSRVDTIADRLLAFLSDDREDCQDRPIIFIAHCFGGIVLMKAMIDAVRSNMEYPGISSSTVGIIFLSTPFRGAEGLSRTEVLAGIYEYYEPGKVQENALNVLQPHDVVLQMIVDDFCKSFMAVEDGKPEVVCFYEIMRSDVGKSIGKPGDKVIVVSKASGCLDPSSPNIKKHGLARDHYDMNKFGWPRGGDFRLLKIELKRMIEAIPGVVEARAGTDFDTQVASALSAESTPGLASQTITNNIGDMSFSGGQNDVASTYHGSVTKTYNDNKVDNTRNDNSRNYQGKVDRRKFHGNYYETNTKMGDVNGVVVGHSSGQIKTFSGRQGRRQPSPDSGSSSGWD